MSGRLLWPLLIAAVLVFMLGPLLLVVLFSFGTNALIGLPLEGLTLDWYRRLAAEPEFWTALWHSLLIAGSVGAVASVTGTTAALALSRIESRSRGIVLATLSLPIMLPPLVLAVALVVFFVRLLGIQLSLLTVIAAHVLITQPFVVLVVLARLARFDWASVDAARDLGCTRTAAFWRVTFPQIRAAIVGAALIAMAISLDDFIVTVFTIGSGNTLSTFVWGRIRTTLDPSINAIATILLVLSVTSTVAALRLTRFRG